MTLSTTACWSRFAGNGSTTEFSIAWHVAATGHVVVTRVDQDGNETLLVEDQDYHIVLADPAPGAVITYPYDVGPDDPGSGTILPTLPVGETLVVYRHAPLTQEKDIVASGTGWRQTTEAGLDALTARLQEIDHRMARSLRMTDSDAPGALTALPNRQLRAGKILYFDADGNPSASRDNYIDQAATAAASANDAAASAAAAADSAAAANMIASAATQSFDQLDDRYLGAKASDPATDNDGDPLLTGALYFNSTSGQMRVWDGTTWVIAASVAPVTGDMFKADNLAGLADNDAACDTIGAARTNTDATFAGALTASNFYQNGAPLRTPLTADTTFYVWSGGDDTSGDGTIYNTWATIQKAVDHIYRHIDTAGFTAIIRVDAGTYTNPTVIDGPIPGGGKIKISGDTANPSAVAIATVDAACLYVVNGAQIEVEGVKLSSSGGSSSGLHVQYQSSAHIVGNMEFGQFDNYGRGLLAYNQSIIRISAPYIISGNARGHAIVKYQSQILWSAITVTLAGGPSFSGGFIFHYEHGFSRWDNTVFSGSATGKRYFLDYLSICDTDGAGSSYLPGNSAGEKYNGSYYR